LSYLYIPINLYAAWKYLKGRAVLEEEFALHGVTKIEGVESGNQLQNLPHSDLDLMARWVSGRFLWI